MAQIVYDVESKQFNYQGFATPMDTVKAIQALKVALAPERTPSINSAALGTNVKFAEKNGRIIVACVGYASRNFSAEQLKEGYGKLLEGDFAKEERSGEEMRSKSGVRFVTVATERADEKPRLIGEAVLVAAHKAGLC